MPPTAGSALALWGSAAVVLTEADASNAEADQPTTSGERSGYARSDWGRDRRMASASSVTVRTTSAAGRTAFTNPAD